MVESIEHLSPELNLHSLGYRERLDDTEVNIPVAGRDKDVPACAILSRRRDAEGLSEIDAAGESSHRFEQDGSGEWRPG